VEIKNYKNKEPFVLIIMSTYNGAKYLEKQLESIYNQTYKNFRLFVRDDGSSDGTVEILKRYETKGALTLTCGENIGFVKSFFWLLKNAPEADYYSFSDQDDEWFDFQIERAVDILSKNDFTAPSLYFSDFDICDADLNSCERRTTKSNELSFVESLADGNRTVGFTCLISGSFKDLVVKADPGNLFSHDHFMYILSFLAGTQIYDRVSTAKYRRHGKNASQSRSEFFRLQLWRVKNFLLKNNDRFRKMYNEILSNYPEFLDDEKKRILLSFVRDYNSLRNRLFKFFYPRRFRQNLMEEFFLRLLFLIGKM